jgi:hypothetical protein
MSPSVTPPCRKSKHYDAINLYDDIAPGSVSFNHPLESDLGEYGAFPILECVVGSFDEFEAVRHNPSVRVGARVAQRPTDDADGADKVSARVNVAFLDDFPAEAAWTEHNCHGRRHPRLRLA